MRTLTVIALCLAFASTQAAPKQKPKAVEKTDPITVAHERVKEVLNDPDSAKFRSEFAAQDGTVCGFVNAKNRYGGYDGFRRYIVEPTRVMVDSANGNSWKMDSHWTDVCAAFEPPQ